MEKSKTRTLAINPDSALALEMREKAAELQRTADELLAKRRLARGTERIPRQSPGEYYVGNEGPTSELLEVVKAMLTGHAKTFREILDMTGAGENRVKGVIMRLQRDGVSVVNVGSDTRALWTIMTPEAYTRIRAAMEAKMRAKKRG